FATHNAYTCTASSCTYSNEIRGKGGPSPLYLAVYEGDGHNITKGYGTVTPTFPKNAWTIARTHCAPGCAAAVTFQQGYDVMVSAFYGLEAPAGWKSKP
ncbi:MAG: hypothetical protein HYT80_03535, partial [Euryarchaeota archaeon]|nr:hypothetical protein [Euryarchaeota archaeon]